MFTTTTTIHQFSQATRSPETELLLGGWATPAGPTPAATFLRHAGERRSESRLANPACEMIAAGAPLTHPAPKSRVCHSGVKSATVGNRPTVASLSSEGSSRKIQGGTSRRKEAPAQSVGRKPRGGRHTLEPKGKGHEAWETGWTTHRAFGKTPGSSAEAPAGCSGPLRAQKPQRNVETSASSRSVRPSRIWPHARVGQVADHAKAPGQRRGYAKFGIGTSRQTSQQQP